MRHRDNPLIEKRYNCEHWKKVRKLKKNMANGLCEMCLEEGRATAGKIVHHIEPITEKNYMDDNIMYGLDNLKFVCDSCHIKIHFSEPDEFYFDKEGNVCQKEELKPKLI